MKKYNIVDLFSGAGGLSYGFEMAGFNVLLGIDNDEKALETFQKNHQNSEILCGDIANISYEVLYSIGSRNTANCFCH